MPVHPANKYHLRDLHQEIDFFDRKIAHCIAYERFNSDEERAVAIRKLELKRETLVKAADELVSKGVEYEPKDLPRSIKKQATSAGSSL